jgi:PIN domain nuclease of toxin-antitoxin system
MCLRFAFLLITRVAAWLRLSRREEILRHQLTVLQRRRLELNWVDRALLILIQKSGLQHQSPVDRPVSGGCQPYASVLLRTEPVVG